MVAWLREEVSEWGSLDSFWPLSVRFCEGVPVAVTVAVIVSESVSV